MGVMPENWQEVKMGVKVEVIFLSIAYNSHERSELTPARGA